MKYLFLTLALMHFSLCAFSQDINQDSVSTQEEIFTEVDVKPLMSGCEGAGSITEKTICSERKLADYIDNNLVYPSSSKENGMSGTVVLDIAVLKDGSLGQIKVVRQPSDELGQAAIDIIIGMKNLNEKWLPALKEGKPVSAWYRLPIKFRLYNKVSDQNKNAGINYKFNDPYPKDSILCIGDHCTTPEIRESFSHYYSIESISDQTYFRVSRNNSAASSTSPILSNSRLTRPVEVLEITLVNGFVIKSFLEASKISFRRIISEVAFTDYYFPIHDEDIKIIMSYPIKKLEFGYYKDNDKLKSANSWTPDRKEAVQISKWVKVLFNS
jgi:TonB family protein